MRNIEKPGREDVAGIVASLGSLSDWSKGFLPLLASHLRKNPVQYRNFGPWWWVVKKAMLDAGFAPFGQDVDAEMLEAMLDPEDPAFSLLLAQIYYEFSLENHFVGQATHTMVDNGEDVEYTVYDHDAEAFIRAGGFL
ncbi:hypothetical protein [Desulforhabdus sp. TSK]|uniref:hypothetical protein n=1 Tax=Desulforhabdus sp. TSK TaxID=2925014 RepID=UPI001FC8598D|nr:hypothetical protein [Desulforhabdus sp. TSK]GKT06955.1 hypothetical protein DSTSK_02600 [Desulforhabdus sp. TSK]